MTIPSNPDAAYVHGLAAAARNIRSFDQPLPGFDRLTCQQLGHALTAMADSAAARLGTAAGSSGPHTAHRGGDVEAWIRRAREQQPPQSNGWYALDDLLDNYREHADTGTPLDAVVAGPNAAADS